MKQLARLLARSARLLGLLAALGAIAYVLRDRLISLTAPRESEPPRFRPMPRPAPIAPSEPPVEAPAAEPADAEDLTAINGIGPVFARRLAEHDITTFAQLAAQDPATLADRIEVPQARLEPWIEEAKGRG